MEPLPSPKSQFHATTEPLLSVLVSVKSTVSSLMVQVKLAVGMPLDGTP